jgi:hypothetical protein
MDALKRCRWILASGAALKDAPQSAETRCSERILSAQVDPSEICLPTAHTVPKRHLRRMCPFGTAADGIQVATVSPEKSCAQQGDMSVVRWQPEGVYVSSYTPSERYDWNARLDFTGCDGSGAFRKYKGRVRLVLYLIFIQI